MAAIQEVRWPRTGEREFRAVEPVANTAFKYNIYHSGSDKAEHGVGFIVIGKQMKRVMRWKPINERICVLKDNLHRLQPKAAQTEHNHEH